MSSHRGDGTLWCEAHLTLNRDGLTVTLYQPLGKTWPELPLDLTLPRDVAMARHVNRYALSRVPGCIVAIGRDGDGDRRLLLSHEGLDGWWMVATIPDHERPARSGLLSLLQLLKWSLPAMRIGRPQLLRQGGGDA